MKMLIGHSKGNLVISEALFEMKELDSARLKQLAKQMLIVTVSAKIAMPPDFQHIVDIIGQIDGFGALNSRWDLGTEVTVPLAWHHTNSQLPMHLPVTATLRKIPELEKL
jgi:predicted TIM-barrel enzyme